MTYKYPHATVLQFAKAPQSGRVKTRMAAALDRHQCLQLHLRLTAHMANCLSRAGLCPWELWVSSQPQHPFFSRLSASLSVPVHQQGEGNLGEKMRAAAEAVLARSQAVILIGSDCPFIDADYLQQALSALGEGADAVVGPASDGGYVLLGLRQVHRRLFDDIPWSTDRVWPLTRRRLRQLGWRFCELATLADIDRPEDLVLLRGTGLEPG